MSNLNLRKHFLVNSIGGALFALSANGLLAQEIAKTNEQKADTPPEQVIVTGVRRSLENALQVKRQASSIVDHITADDIGELPALDLGEALQAIPGIQLNVENTQRTSDVNLRGLPGGFILTTSNGFGFATPSLSASQRGASNPFGAFESSIFRGVTVVKTPTADMPDGAIAGYIDKKLPKSLTGKRDAYSINIGARYEQLNDSFDPEFSFRGKKTLIEDVLAISGTYATSKQRFRRDSLNFTRYEEFTDEARDSRSNPNMFGFFDGGDVYPFNTIDEYKASVDLSPEDKLLYASEVRQFSESADGQRDSYALNIEWQALDSLKIGLDLLGTEKDLSGTQDIFILGNRATTGGVIRNPNFPGVQENGNPEEEFIPERAGVNNVTPTAGVDPIFGFVDDNGVNNYVVTDYSYSNAQYFPGNRDTDRFEKTDGVFLTATWEHNDWVVEGGLSTSKAEASRINAQFDARYQPANNSADLNFTNGVSGRFFTGNDNLLNDYVLEIDGFQNLDLSGDFRYMLRTSDNQPHEQLDRLLTQTNLRNNGTRVDAEGNTITFDNRILITSNEQFIDREMDTYKIDVERALDVDFFDTLKFGAYGTKEEFSRRILQNTSAYANLEGISNDLLQPAEFAAGNDFFNGNLPGFAGIDSGWQAVNVSEALNLLTPGITARYNEVYQDLLDHQTVEEGNTANDALTDEEKAQAVEFYATPELTSIGFLRRRGGTFENNAYSSQREVRSVYVMTEFSGELGTVGFSGNVGLRYSKTDNEAFGLVVADANDPSRLFDDEYSVSNPKNSYDSLLPSLNLAFELTDDLVLRAAYYEAISRPNVAGFRPNGSIRENQREVNIRVADSKLEPFQADSVDLSLSWYNRAGSVVSLGLFQKDVRGQSEVRKRCPADGGGFGFGTFTSEGTGDTLRCFADQQTVLETLDDMGNVIDTDLINREFFIDERFVKEEEQTIRGIEATIQQNLDFLPEPWSRLGGQLNYSHVTNDGERIIGISENSYNAVTYYETDNFTARLSYNYRDSYLLNSQGSFTGFENREVKPRGRMDLSLSYKLTRDLRVTLRGFNLLDEVYEEFQSGNTNLPKRTNYDGRIYSLSANIKF